LLRGGRFEPPAVLVVLVLIAGFIPA
jgi:hypothetical protein